eukprot:6178576-Pleurochrysis_carterae.AAC.3
MRNEIGEEGNRGGALTSLQRSPFAAQPGGRGTCCTLLWRRRPRPPPSECAQPHASNRPIGTRWHSSEKRQEEGEGCMLEASAAAAWSLS